MFQEHPPDLSGDSDCSHHGCAVIGNWSAGIKLARSLSSLLMFVLGGPCIAPLVGAGRQDQHAVSCHDPKQLAMDCSLGPAFDLVFRH